MIYVPVSTGVKNGDFHFIIKEWRWIDECRRKIKGKRRLQLIDTDGIASYMAESETWKINDSKGRRQGNRGKAITKVVQNTLRWQILLI